MILSTLDKEQLEQRGIAEEDVRDQVAKLRNGMRYVRVERPATVGDGIILIDGERKDHWARYYDERRSKIQVVKMVPASGAATRMFKELHLAMQSDEVTTGAAELMERLEEFPFFEEVQKIAEQLGIDLNSAIDGKDHKIVIDLILGSDKLGYGNLPKGLLPFHSSGGETRTAFEEQIAEALKYAEGKEGVIRLHLTISPEHQQGFDQLKEDLSSRYKESIEVTFSYQDPSTDTVAIDENDELVRINDELLIRPGGHGALLANLNTIDADLVFIKNIDNVQPERLQSDVAREKKMLGGLCLYFREKADELYTRLLNTPNENVIKEAEQFIREYFRSSFESNSVQELIEILDRPIRVCGMVKNEGEPGGGPFWVDGKVQIVEKSQINAGDNEQLQIMESSSHFNPVDIVCSTKGPNGPYDLRKFVDSDAYITTTKSVGGKEIRVLEHPGLWNGAMAEWNTVFVEVPAFTFSPVKTVFDLLRKSHQA